MCEIMEMSNILDIVDYDFYKNDIENYRDTYVKNFEAIGKLVSKINENLNEKENIKLEGRIKSYNSFYKNISNGKNVDDCYGIRIIAEQEKLEQLMAIIKSVYSIKREKDHSKNNKTDYNAIHDVVWSNNQTKHDLPLIEIQYWTPEIEQKCTVGNLAYYIYKGKNIENIYENIMELNGEELKKSLPEYYKINDEGKAVKLSQQETIRKLFPTLFIQNDNNKKDVVEISDYKREKIMNKDANQEKEIER